MTLTAAESGGWLHVSTDAGVTWAARATDTGRGWMGVASSPRNKGQVCTSGDAGLTWTARDITRYRTACAISAEGDALFAAPSSDTIVTSTSWSTIGTRGSISGSAYDSVDLQSLGDGRFNVIGHEGSLTVE